MDKKLAELSTDELAELKKQWYEQARADGSIEVCGLVARQLGERLQNRFGPKFKWENDGLEIYVDDYGGYMSAALKGKLVCSTHGCSRLFIPGDWMNAVWAAKLEAEKRQLCSEVEREQERRETLLAELTL